MNLTWKSCDLVERGLLCNFNVWSINPNSDLSNVSLWLCEGLWSIWLKSRTILYKIRRSRTPNDVFWSNYISFTESLREFFQIAPRPSPNYRKTKHSRRILLPVFEICFSLTVVSFGEVYSSVRYSLVYILNKKRK